MADYADSREVTDTGGSVAIVTSSASGSNYVYLAANSREGYAGYRQPFINPPACTSLGHRNVSAMAAIEYAHSFTHISLP